MLAKYLTAPSTYSNKILFIFPISIAMIIDNVARGCAASCAVDPRRKRRESQIDHRRRRPFLLRIPIELNSFVPLQACVWVGVFFTSSLQCKMIGMVMMLFFCYSCWKKKRNIH
jgi:hypothetical protein